MGFHQLLDLGGYGLLLRQQLVLAVDLSIPFGFFQLCLARRLLHLIHRFRLAVPHTFGLFTLFFLNLLDLLGIDHAGFKQLILK